LLARKSREIDDDDDARENEKEEGESAFSGYNRTKGGWPRTNRYAKENVAFYGLLRGTADRRGAGLRECPI